MPPYVHSLQPLFNDSEYIGDVVVFGLQEVIKLNFISSVFSSGDGSVVQKWVDLLTAVLNKIN